MFIFEKKMKNILTAGGLIIISFCISCSNTSSGNKKNTLTPEQVKEMILSDFENINNLFQQALSLILSNNDDETIRAKETLDNELILLAEKYTSAKTSKKTEKYVTSMLSYIKVLQIFSNSHLHDLMSLYEHSTSLSELTDEYQIMFENTLNDLSIKHSIEREILMEVVHDLPEKNREELDY